MAMVALAAVSVSAAVVPLATVGSIYTGPSAYTGGSLYYQFILSSTVAGSLEVKSTLTPSGGKWLPKPTIPVWTGNVTSGNNTITSQSVAIPSDFLGNATLTLAVTLNKKSIPVKPVKVAIVPQVNFYDVGFGKSVILNAAGISTAGMGAHPIYAWTQLPNSLGVTTSGGNLSSNSTVAPTLTTGLKALTDLVGSTVPDLVALDNEQVTNSTYVYQVVVSGNKITRNGTFTVACGVQTPGTDLPVGVNALYMGGNTTSGFTLGTKPTGSNATLTTLTDGTNIVAQLRPDLAGNYTVTSIPTTGNATTITKYAASYHGISTCSGCHGPGGPGPDMVTPWLKTGHATMAQRGIDGLVSPYYNETCFQCHTLGYNQSAASAVNGNFKAVANQLGWQFPSKLQAGNFAAMPAKLQNLANIQCESCHGPVFAPGSPTHGSVTISLDVQVCASCHQDGLHHNRVAQWENGPHSSPYQLISVGEGPNPGCARCHSPNGFEGNAEQIDDLIAAGTDAATAQKMVGSGNATATGIGPLTCQTCHDPHNAFPNAAGVVDPDRHQVRIWDTVVVGDLAAAGNVTLSNELDATTGNSAACEICHNSRRLPMQISSGSAYYTKTRSGVISGPHESPIAEVFNGVYSSAVNYGYQMGNSYHTYMADCQTCHMYQLRDVDSKGVPQDYVSINGTYTPVTAALYKNLRDLVGDHSFSVANQYTTGNVTSEVQDVAACNQCHTEPVTTFDFKSVNARDYDGDGVIAGIQTETQGLLDEVRALLTSQGVLSGPNPTSGLIEIYSAGLSANAALKDAQLQAAWNWYLIYRDHSLGVHNTQFTIRLLQTTWTSLSVANGGPTFHVAYPNAFLR